MKRAIAFTLGAVIVSGCTNGSIHKKGTIGALSYLALDARQRLVISGTVGGKPVVCAEPSPDAFAIAAASLAATGRANVPTTGGGGPAVDASGGIALGSAASGGSIGLRTEAIQLMRDGYFRSCEAYLNGVIDKEKYFAIVRRIDVLMAALVGVTAIGGTVQAPPITVSAASNASTTQNGVSSQSSPESKVPNITINNSGENTEAAQQIAAIVREYYKLREQMYCEDAVAKYANDRNASLKSDSVTLCKTQRGW